MKLSVSNIAWSPERDETVLILLKKHGFSGVEIAPTRLFPEAPYDKIEEAKAVMLEDKVVDWLLDKKPTIFDKKTLIIATEKEDA